MQPESITRRFGTILLAAVLFGLAAAGRAQETWRDAPEYLALFAPQPHRGRYRAAVSPLSIDRALASLAADASLAHPPGAWQPRAEWPTDAFGTSGNYNRWTLSRLYGARQPLVARGPRMENGRVTESWILISPYPDASLTRLEPGTLRLRVQIPPGL